MAESTHQTPWLMAAFASVAGIFVATMTLKLQNFVALPVVHGLVSVCLVCFLAELLKKRFYLPKAPGGLCLRSLLLFGVFGIFILLIRDLPHGLTWVLFMVSIVWVNDSAAYLVGGKFGKQRLAPDISPGKTIEGAQGAVLASIVCALAINALLLHMPLAYALAYGLGASVISQLSDLHESLTKRKFHVKDSGNILPGHGGVYDRIDSFVFLAPLTYYFIVFVTGS